MKLWVLILCIKGLHFNLGSPNASSGPLLPYTDCQGHTWGLIVQNISYIWPFESSAYPAPQPVNGWQAGQTGVYVPPAQVKYSSINKNQLILFTKNDKNGNPILRFFVTDQWGNMYIIKSSNSADQTTKQIAARFESAVFPAGRSKSSGYLVQNLYSSPQCITIMVMNPIQVLFLWIYVIMPILATV